MNSFLKTVCVLASSLFLVACALPMNVGGQASYRGSHGGITIGGASAQPMQGGYGHGAPVCPPGSQFDGRGCRIVQQGGVTNLSPSACPSGFQMRNNRWVCMGY